ncbi:hypothetical protein SMACR_09344 [Sordaria macrospora]|uniref:WGS project CABT00000000 data, contig 2.86 n=2 Tax=Sordaria macrospora TaxID=5147 RepID=F7WBV3_SORMK|nr:uncharacterized protein SMAC_09344 [Sordaria macrospora k-hell]KAA8629401.1 hypothetical protein SMACR_09344 [Sordaria macrospora]WPJ65060.1 hypothetical protein SMAC4_09344 [Sordaria macrospora]CCC05497.1 unnamed protein product [Sordaria macrospora k-hell]
MSSLTSITRLIALLSITANINGNPIEPSLDNRDGSDRHYPHPPHDPPHTPYPVASSTASLEARDPQWSHGPNVHDNHHYPHPPHDTPPSITVTPTTTTTAAPTVTPPSIVSVPIISSFETNIDLGVTQQPRGPGRSLPVQPTTFAAVVKRA